MQKLTVNFLGQEITLIDNHGVPYVAMREIVLGIGLDWKGQHTKLIENREKFNCGVISTVAKDGKQREMLCIPIKKLNGWLFGLNPNKVRLDLKVKLEHYQEECFLALWDYWTQGVARRDEVKDKLAAWQAKKQDYQQRSREKGKALQACKAEKAALEREFAAIQQMALFLDI